MQNKQKLTQRQNDQLQINVYSDYEQITSLLTITSSNASKQATNLTQNSVLSNELQGSIKLMKRVANEKLFVPITTLLALDHKITKKLRFLNPSASLNQS